MTKTHPLLAVGLVAMFVAISTILNGTTCMQARAGDEKPAAKEENQSRIAMYRNNRLFSVRPCSKRSGIS